MNLQALCDRLLHLGERVRNHLRYGLPLHYDRYEAFLLRFRLEQEAQKQLSHHLYKKSK